MNAGPAIRVSYNDDTGALRLSVLGPLTADTVAQARDALLQALDEHPGSAIVLDLGSAAAADRTALQLLLDMADELRTSGRAGPPRPPRSH